MNAGSSIMELTNNKMVFERLLGPVSSDEYAWRSSTEKWSLLEIVCHLRDEEREDFRARTRGTLEDPNKPFTPIDPQGWVKDRGYAKEDHDRALHEFLNERQRSVEWLNSLEDPKWDNVYHHEQLGHLSAQLFLENWVAHDMLHIRQIMNTRLAYLKHIAKESLEYAGL